MTDNTRETPLVLVADDELSMLTLVARHIRSLGFQVVEASDGSLAWQQAVDKLPDLVVLDVMMPGMSGWEVCKNIRETPALTHTGIIMLTGIGESLNELTSPLYGADAHIDKPFDFDDLDEKIREVLDARQQETQVAGSANDDLSDLDAIDHPITPDDDGPTASYSPKEGTREAYPANDSRYVPESKPMPRFELAEEDEDEEFYNAVTLRPPSGAEGEGDVALPPPPGTPKILSEPTRKTTAKKRRASKRKAPAKKSSTKKAPAKKTPAKKTPAKKSSTKKAPAKKTPAKKSSTKKAPAKKTPAKKSSTKKAPAKKTPAKKSSTKKAPAKKSSTKKASSRKSKKA